MDMQVVDDTPVKLVRAAEPPSPEGSDSLSDRAAVLDAIEQGLADVVSSRVVDDAELDEVLEARLGDLLG